MSEKTIKIQTKIKLPWFDQTKFEYVPFVWGQEVGEDWLSCHGSENAWHHVVRGALRHDINTHYIRPIPKPDLEPGFMWPDDDDELPKIGWRWIIDREGRWFAQTVDYEECDRGYFNDLKAKGVLFAKPIPNPPNPPNPTPFLSIPGYTLAAKADDLSVLTFVKDGE